MKLRTSKKRIIVGAALGGCVAALLVPAYSSMALWVLAGASIGVATMLAIPMMVDMNRC